MYLKIIMLSIFSFILSSASFNSPQKKQTLIDFSKPVKVNNIFIDSSVLSQSHRSYPIISNKNSLTLKVDSYGDVKLVGSYLKSKIVDFYKFLK